jgi:hypothetical protein
MHVNPFAGGAAGSAASWPKVGSLDECVDYCGEKASEVRTDVAFGVRTVLTAARALGGSGYWCSCHGLSAATFAFVLPSTRPTRSCEALPGVCVLEVVVTVHLDARAGQQARSAAWIPQPRQPQQPIVMAFAWMSSVTSSEWAHTCVCQPPLEKVRCAKGSRAISRSPRSCAVGARAVYTFSLRCPHPAT